MNADLRRLEQDKITENIILGAYKVGNKLGCGFLEKVYENALAIELAKLDLQIRQQAALVVKYDGINIGDYYADIMVNQSVLIELKAVKQLNEVHIAQCLNYLKATNFKVCLLINFGNVFVKDGITRIVNELI